MRSFLNTNAALKVYKNMLLPMLEYRDIFLSAASNINRSCLQVIQNKGLRCPLNKGIEMSIDELHDQANLLKLKYRREQHLINFMYHRAQDHTMLKSKSSHSMRMRSSKKKLLRIKCPYIEKSRICLAYRGPKQWNALPDTFHHTQTKAAFKISASRLIQDKSNKAGGAGVADVSLI